MDLYNPDHPLNVDGINYNYGIVNECGPQYRLGAAYIGWGNYRIGANSEWIRNFIQNNIAHGRLSPQPGFIMLSRGVNPYFQYQTPSIFTSW